MKFLIGFFLPPRPANIINADSFEQHMVMMKKAAPFTNTRGGSETSESDAEWVLEQEWSGFFGAGGEVDRGH